jgi:hypothetical protein
MTNRRHDAAAARPGEGGGRGEGKDVKRPAGARRYPGALLLVPPHGTNKQSARHDPEEGTMRTSKRWVKLTFNNFSEFFPDDYPMSLVAGLKVGEGGVAQNAPQVADFLAWVAGQGTPDTEYFCNRFEASRILGYVAGARPD